MSLHGFPDVDGYEILTMLGCGGLGVVYKARHVRLNRHVPLIMRLTGSSATPTEGKRFLREAGAVASLRHPNIVQIFDLGEQGTQLYFTM